MVMTVLMLLVQIQRVEKSSTSDGILASVWKFHKEEDEDLKSRSNIV